MSLAPGMMVGPYEIGALLGTGGMGEVYRARDTKLKREVAVKVLPEIFATDGARKLRFEREAKLLASLNHPNIAHLYGLEDAGAVHALVMELVDGATLAERIAQGPMALEEAVVLAKQIADGLEYAHERGIIHRDLKPANIKVTPDGQAKILDFGLAKALAGDSAEGDIATSPTISVAATTAGVLLAPQDTCHQNKPRQVRRPACGHLGIRLCAVRNAHGDACVRRGNDHRLVRRVRVKNTKCLGCNRFRVRPRLKLALNWVNGVNAISGRIPVVSTAHVAGSPGIATRSLLPLVWIPACHPSKVHSISRQ